MEPVPASLDTNETKTKSEETLKSSTVPSSAATASHSGIAIVDIATVPSSTPEQVTEQTTTVAADPPVTYTETNKATASAISPGKWIVNGTNKVCLVVQMSVAFNISYMDDNHTVCIIIIFIITF